MWIPQFLRGVFPNNEIWFHVWLASIVLKSNTIMMSNRRRCCPNQANVPQLVRVQINPTLLKSTREGAGMHTMFVTLDSKGISTSIQALLVTKNDNCACPGLPHIHTFSAFWLWSSVVSVLISVTTDILPTGRLLVTPIFLWGGRSLSLLEGTSRVALALHYAGCGTPLGVIKH